MDPVADITTAAKRAMPQPAAVVAYDPPKEFFGYSLYCIFIMMVYTAMPPAPIRPAMTQQSCRQGDEGDGEELMSMICGKQI